MKWFKNRKWYVHYASAGEESVSDCDVHVTIPFTRSPLSFRNISAYFKLKKLIDREKYDIIHAHTPTGGAIARLAARRARKNGTRVMYTAHGFHFYKSAPLLNWLIYYPIEKSLSRLTDDLITINSEDYDIAHKKFHAKRVYKINGVGTDLKRFLPVSPTTKQALRETHNYSKDDFIIICVAELNKNKNQRFLLEALAQSSKTNWRLLLGGDGVLAKQYKQLVTEMRLTDQVEFLGYQRDLRQLYQLSDVIVSASIREGLGLGIIEGMACGIPAVCSNNRGHREIITNGKNGWLFDIADKDSFLTILDDLSRDKILAQEIAAQGLQRARDFSLKKSLATMQQIYTLKS